MLLKTNKHLPFTFLLLIGMLLGYTSCRRNLETSNQGRHTPTTSSQTPPTVTTNNQGQDIVQTNIQSPPTVTTNNQGQDIVQTSIQSQPTVTSSSRQASPTAKKPNRAGKIPIEEALPDALIDRVGEHLLMPALQQHLRELRKYPATIDEVVPCRHGTEYTVLQLAAMDNKLELLQALLEAGADPNAKNSETGRTALHGAVEGGHLGVVKALIAAGANINQSGNDGQTPLQLAAIHGKVEVLQALLQGKVNLNARNSRTGRTALHGAVEGGHLEFIKARIAAGANINQTDNDGNTPLQLAAIHGKVEVLKALLQGKVNLNARNSKYKDGSNGST